jgi:hypothetical protein
MNPFNENDFDALFKNNQANIEHTVNTVQKTVKRSFMVVIFVWLVGILFSAGVVGTLLYLLFRVLKHNNLI